MRSVGGLAARLGCRFVNRSVAAVLLVAVVVAACGSDPAAVTTTTTHPVLPERPELAVDQMVAENPDKLERSFMILTDHKVGVGLNKQNTELAHAIMDGLTAIRENGTERAIYDKYHIDYQLAQPLELLTE